MNDHLEENGQFKLQSDHSDEEIEKTSIPPEINELKLEKVSQRVTLISIMIPVLIVIVLVIAYLDIKKRVVRTEDTGTIEFQKLSTDLESRFSSLSVRQARLEDDMAKLVDQTNHSLATIQVRLKELQETLTQVQTAQKGALKQRELTSVKEEFVEKINALVDSSNQTSEQMAAITDKLKTQMDELTSSVAETDRTVSDIQEQVTRIDNNKIDKPAMDLALRLETMRVASDLKAKIDSMEEKLIAIEERLQQTPATPRSSPQKAPKTSSKSAPSSTANKPTAATPSSGKIEEQTITK